ncbi:MAG TPA: DUF6457 domain-containing protein [Acidimicrobiales bacterium]|nr:DUF6457 domain-containing protein [Acidimicrobiales bacterium]
MEATEWLSSFAAALGADPPTEDEVEALLEIAGVAAHASARTAAPIACWLLGRAGVPPADALPLARRVEPGGG